MVGGFFICGGADVQMWRPAAPGADYVILKEILCRRIESAPFLFCY